MGDDLKPPVKIIKDVRDYGCSDELPENDDRHDHFKKQREERGFDDTELWGLDCTIAKFIVPRLKAFLPYTEAAYPAHLKPEDSDEGEDKATESWTEIVQAMIDGFEIIANDQTVMDDEEKKKVQRALDLFRDYYFHLWY
jgi:hypothetical protein